MEKMRFAPCMFTCVLFVLSCLCFGGEGYWDDGQVAHQSDDADVDGDGLDDRVLVDGPWIQVGLADAFDFAPDQTWGEIGLLIEEQGLSFTSLKDVNGDGLADLILFTEKCAHVALSEGMNFATPEPWLTLPGVGTGWHIRWVDLNNDGMPDLTGKSEDFYFSALSNGRGFTYSSSKVRSEKPVRYGKAAGGNGNGRNNTTTTDSTEETTTTDTTGTELNVYALLADCTSNCTQRYTLGDSYYYSIVQLTSSWANGEIINSSKELIDNEFLVPETVKMINFILDFDLSHYNVFPEEETEFGECTQMIAFFAYDFKVLSVSAEWKDGGIDYTKEVAINNSSVEWSSDYKYCKSRFQINNISSTLRPIYNITLMQHIMSDLVLVDPLPDSTKNGTTTD